jgi:hypothetical protein
MKKFVVLLVVVAMTCLTSMAFAADVTVGGTVQVRSRDFSQLDMNKDANPGTNQRDTQERIQIDVNAKTDSVKGKIAVWNDFESWGTEAGASGANAGPNAGSLESEQGQGAGPGAGKLGIREAWLSFNIPGLPVNLTGGHQLLALANGWFFRSMHFGSDAWVVANQTGNNTVALVNVKVAEGNTAKSDDVDAYVLLDVFKLNDANTVGIDITDVKDRVGALGGLPGSDLQNIGVNYNGKLGPVALKAQVDLQMGKIKVAAPGTDMKFKGNEVVIQGNVALNPVTVNFTLGRGTGAKAGQTDVNQFVNFMDVDPHYTFLYEYKIATAAGRKNTGMSNTTAIGVGATADASKSLKVGANVWMLSATEKTNVTQTGGGAGAASDKIGTEVDVTVNWKLYDNLAWNWNIGYFKPGDAYKDAAGKGTDAATGIQGILAFSF